MRGSKYPLLNDREWLYQRYFVDHWTVERIANHIGCFRQAVNRAFKRFGWETIRRNPNRVVFDEAELRELVQDKTVTEIAKLKGCSPPPVRAALRGFGIEIPKRSRKGQIQPRDFELGYDYLYERYLTWRWTAQRIADEKGCTKHTVVRRLAELGIVRRKRTSKFPDMTPERLRHLYLVELKSTVEIGAIFGTTPGNVGTHLRKAGVELRSGREAHRAKYPAGRSGSKAARWHGGRRMKGKYWFLHREAVEKRWPDHPRLALSDWTECQEHILVWEAGHEQLVPEDACVHHKNGIKTDNRLENLTLRGSNGEHISEHWAAGHRAVALEAENERLRAELERLRREDEEAA